MTLQNVQKTGADTGFSVGGGANPRGASTYKFAGFSQKLHEIKKILVRRRGAGSAPLVSATEKDKRCH